MINSRLLELSQFIMDDNNDVVISDNESDDVIMSNDDNDHKDKNQENNQTCKGNQKIKENIEELEFPRTYKGYSNN